MVEQDPPNCLSPIRILHSFSTQVLQMLTDSVFSSDPPAPLLSHGLYFTYLPLALSMALSQVDCPNATAKNTLNSKPAMLDRAVGSMLASSKVKFGHASSVFFG